jgi:hypothetical protein
MAQKRILERFTQAEKDTPTLSQALRECVTDVPYFRRFRLDTQDMLGYYNKEGKLQKKHIPYLHHQIIILEHYNYISVSPQSNVDFHISSEDFVKFLQQHK